MQEQDKADHGHDILPLSKFSILEDHVMRNVCEQYLLDINKDKMASEKDMLRMINESISKFKEKHGYRPLWIMMRQEEAIDVRKMPLQVVMVTTTMPLHNIRLFPVVDRKPVIAVERIPYES